MRKLVQFERLLRPAEQPQQTQQEATSKQQVRGFWDTQYELNQQQLRSLLSCCNLGILSSLS